MKLNKRENFSADTRISKTLSWLLRHGAKKEGLQISRDGFIDLESLLAHRSLVQKKCNIEDVFRIVENDGKNRYTLIKSEENGKWRIKANQGHSMEEVDELNIKKVTDPSEIPIVVHGTYYSNWDNIKVEGLKRMNRNHIHFTDSEVFNKSFGTKISGFRANCEILIYIDSVKAMRNGITFFKSENNVILSPGIEGVIAPNYFLKVIDRKTGELLNLN